MMNEQTHAIQECSRAGMQGDGIPHIFLWKGRIISVPVPEATQAPVSQSVPHKTSILINV